MPRDSKGNFHLNSQKAMAADKMGSDKPKPKAMGPAMHSTAAPAEQGEDQGAGKSPHEMLAHLSATHGGKHMLIHHSGGSITSHHVAEDGEPQGPHTHASADDLKSHLDQFLNDGQESAGDHAAGEGLDGY